MHVGETRRIRTYFRKDVPPWFLFPLLCMAAVYDIACQCQVVERSGAPSWQVASEGRTGADGLAMSCMWKIKNVKSVRIAGENRLSRGERFSLARKPGLWWAFTITVVRLERCVVCPNPRSGCLGCSAVQSRFCVQRVT